MKKKLTLISFVLVMLLLFSTVAYADAGYNTWQSVSGTYLNAFTSSNKVTRTSNQSWNKFDMSLTTVTWNGISSSSYYSYTYPCTAGGTRRSTTRLQTFAGNPRTFTLTSAGQSETALYARFTKDNGISSSTSVYVYGAFKAYHD